MTYIDKDGIRYEIRWLRHKLTAVLMSHSSVVWTKFDKVKGSAKREVVEQRLKAYAEKHNWLAYPEVICAECAKAAGAVWPEGHIATFYRATCGICGKMEHVTESRDWGHFTTVEKLKALYRLAKGGEPG